MRRLGPRSVPVVPNTGRGVAPPLPGARVSVALLFVVVALAASQAQVTEEGYIKPEESRCWDCHGPGKDTPHMDPAFFVVPEFVTVPVGETEDFTVTLQNRWLSVVQNVRVTMDIRDAPSLQFTGAVGALPDQSVPGAIPIDPAAPTRPQSADVNVTVQNGTTDLVIELVPDDQSENTGPDLTLYVQPAEDQDPADSIIDPVDERGKGATERFQAKGGAAFGQYGFGQWRIRAEMTPATAGTSPVLDPAVGDVGFTVRVTSWSNATGEVQKVVVDEGEFGVDNVGGGGSVFTFPLEVLSEPGAGERVLLTVNSTLYHDHDNANDPDYLDALYDVENMPVLEVPVRAEGGAAVLGTDTGDTIVPAPVIEGVSIARVSEAVGYASAFLLIGSIYTGGMFGKTSRRQLNKVFGSAKRRVAFHNFLSYGLTLAALVHMFIFIWDVNTALQNDGYHWLVGVLWGGPAILAMLGLGVTGAVQVPMIRRWNYATWRYTHLWLAYAAIAFTLVHMALDGANFAFLQNALGWDDPLVPEGF